MELILIRHAPAGDRAEWALTGRPDEERPLTDEGARRMRKGAKGLRRVLETPDSLFTSPLLRARQTAEIICEVYSDMEPEVAPGLEPEAAPVDTLAWLAERRRGERIALIGHEPHLSRLLALLIHGDDTLETLTFRKGGVAVLDMEHPAPANARLIALLPPRVLRALG
ncbi:MAG: phosphohistidine phosphatase SixA [Pseudomonadota bacterium]